MLIFCSFPDNCCIKSRLLKKKISDGENKMEEVCEVCGEICYPKGYNWEGIILCLDCFLWYSNKYIIDERAATIEEG
jgi:hypothetical protein